MTTAKTRPDTSRARPELARDRRATRLRHTNLKSPAWRTWAVIVGLLLAGLGGKEDARLVAMCIAAGQGAVYVARPRSLVHFPTQVRVTMPCGWRRASSMSWFRFSGS